VIQRTATFGLLIVLILGISASAYDRSEFLFLDEIEIGMSGIGKTIIAQDIIEEFAVEVLGVIDNTGTLSDFIVVRVSGDVIGRAGGIAQGMSGSPVYIDGKLIGAVSRAANWSKAITPIGLVTPIEPMLALIDSANASEVTQANSDAVLDELAHVELAQPPSEALTALSPDALFSYPVSVPLMASGLSGRSLTGLMDGWNSLRPEALLITDVLPNASIPEFRGLAAYGLSLLPMSGDGGTGEADPATLVAGGSVGVALASGDISMGALGTITYRDEDTLVGFGHSFLTNGLSQFPLTAVSIIDTMKSLQASFKLGTIGASLGTILEDRTAGIAGRLGPVAQQIGLAIGVYDSDRNAAQTFTVDLVDEPHLVPELLLTAGFEAIDSTIDRLGQGTVEVTIQIDGDNMPFPLERRDIYFSSTDVAVYGPWQLASIVAFLQYNAFEDPEITQISTTLQITEEIKGIQIAGLELDRSLYAPGDTVNYTLTLQTFQGEQRIEQGSFTIPPNLYSEVLIVRAYGGPRYLEDGETAATFENLGDLIEAIEDIPSYDQLTVELFAVDPFAITGSGVYGFDEDTWDTPGYAYYGELEVTVPLLLSGNSSAPADDKDAKEESAEDAPGW